MGNRINFTLERIRTSLLILTATQFAIVAYLFGDVVLAEASMEFWLLLLSFLITGFTALFVSGDKDNKD